MMKIVVIKLLLSCILMLNILIGQNKPEYHRIEKEITEIREKFINYYNNEKFKEALNVVQLYDNESDTTILIYVTILKAKTNYILGDIEEALSNIESIKELTRDYSRIVRHPLLPDEMGKMNCKVHEHKSNNFCLCQYLDERENLETLTEESLSQYFIDVYVVIKDTSDNDYREMISKSQVENSSVKEDGKKYVYYEVEPPPDEVFKTLKNKRYDFKLLNEVIEYENDRALINRRKKLSTSKERLTFTELLPGKKSDYALKIKYLPRFKAQKKAIYKLFIDKKYKYSFTVDKKKKIYIYWDDAWKLADYKDNERIIFYFPDTYHKKINNSDQAFKFDSDYIEDLYMQEYIDETWGLEDYDRYSYGKPDSLIQQDLIINDYNLNQKSIEIELTDKYEHYDKEVRKMKLSRLFLYGCIFTSIIVMSSL